MARRKSLAPRQAYTLGRPSRTRRRGPWRTRRRRQTTTTTTTPRRRRRTTGRRMTTTSVHPATAAREAIRAALDTVPGVTAYASAPDNPHEFDGFPRWSFTG